LPWLGSVLLPWLGSVLLPWLGSVLLPWLGSVLLPWLGSVLLPPSAKIGRAISIEERSKDFSNRESCRTIALYGQQATYILFTISIYVMLIFISLNF
jgi:hypothetical protein